MPGKENFTVGLFSQHSRGVQLSLTTHISKNYKADGGIQGVCGAAHTVPACSFGPSWPSETNLKHSHPSGRHSFQRAIAASFQILIAWRLFIKRHRREERCFPETKRSSTSLLHCQEINTPSRQLGGATRRAPVGVYTKALEDVGERMHRGCWCLACLRRAVPCDTTEQTWSTSSTDNVWYSICASAFTCVHARPVQPVSGSCTQWISSTFHFLAVVLADTLCRSLLAVAEKIRVAL